MGNDDKNWLGKDPSTECCTYAFQFQPKMGKKYFIPYNGCWKGLCVGDMHTLHSRPIKKKYFA